MNVPARSALAIVGLAVAAALSPMAVTRAALPAEPGPGVTPFEAAKAEALLRRRLPCLGCHVVDGVGGRIGVDLSDEGRRRSAEEIRAILADPAAALPAGSPMPRVPMPAAQRDLIARYLASRTGAGGAAEGSPAAPAPPAAPPPTASSPALPPDGAALYARWCAACHGAGGEGDGPNARYLPVPPARHADPAAMSRLPDDVLYDAITAGGYVMGKSPRMPPFGGSLTPAEIRALVGHIRDLCRCEGPAWSRDGRGDAGVGR